MANTKITTNVIADDAITGAKIADDAINSEHYTDGSIDTAHIADDQVTLAKMAGIARGKIIYGDSSGNPAALAVGSNGQVLKSDGTDISWGTDSSNDRDGAAVFNESGADVDFRIEGDTEQNLFFVDGSADKIGIGTASPTAPLTVSYSGTGNLVELISTDAGSSTAPDLSFYRNSSSPADDDNIGLIRFYGNDDGGNKTTYAGIHAYIADASDGSSDGGLIFTTTKADTQAPTGSMEMLRINDGVRLPDDKWLTLGASNDLGLIHDGSNSYISSYYGAWYFDQHVDDGNMIFRCDDQSGGLAEYIALDGGSGMVNMKQKTRVLTASPTILELETTNSSSYKFYIENRYDASNTVNFVWNTTTLMRFTSNYNALALMPGNDPGVAIGTYDDEGHKLNIYRGSSGNCSLKLKTSAGGDPEIHLDSAAANRNGIIKFFDNGSHVGRIDYHHNGDRMELQAGSSTGRTVAITGSRMYVGGITAPTYAGVMVVERDQAGVPMFTVRAINADAVGAAFHVNSQASGNNSIISCWNNSQDGSTADQQFRIRNDGTCFTNNGNTSSLSDRRLKKNIVDYTYDLSKFKSLRTRKFDWENKELHGNKDDVIGFIAQEVDAVDSRWVMQDQLHASSKDVPLVDADLLTFATPLSETDAMYVSVIQQLITRLEAAEAKITALEG